MGSMCGRRLSADIRFHISPATDERLRAAAAASDMTDSDYVRLAVRRYLEAEGARAEVRALFAGAVRARGYIARLLLQQFSREQLDLVVADADRAADRRATRIFERLG